MNTITTKELRDNMNEVVNDLKKGRSFNVSYRHKLVGVFNPVSSHGVSLRRGSAHGIQDYLNVNNFGIVPRSLKFADKSFKEEISKLRAQYLI